MRYTLLEMTQEILSSMDSDEVNSIFDTTEATQVAHVIRNCFYDIVNRSNLPEHYELFQLAETSSDTPTYMAVGSFTEDIKWIKYDWASNDSPQVNMQEICFKPLKEFFDMQDRLNTDNSWVQTMFIPNATGDMYFNITNNAPPRYYTFMGQEDYSNERVVLFDSFDSEVEDFLRSDKTRAYGRHVPIWNMDDSFVPQMSDAQFQLLLNESKSQAWVELKQTPNSKAEQSAKRGWSQIQKTKHKFRGLSDFEQLSNFGRKGSYRY